VKKIIAIDGGGSYTRAALVDERGNVLGQGSAGPSNPNYVKHKDIKLQISQAVRTAFDGAELKPSPVSAAFLGIAGAGTADGRKTLLDAVAPMDLAPADHVEIDHDLAIGLAGGLAGEPGIILVSGTGSACFGINHRGDRVRVGGWGHILDDEGSGYAMSIQGMRACVHAHDGRGPATTLGSKVFEYFDLCELQDLVRLLYRTDTPRTKIAGFAPSVVEAAERGDQPAQQILRGCARDLAALAAVAARRVEFCAPLKITLAGGLARSGEPFEPMVKQEITRQIANCRIPNPVLPPIGGAAIRALARIGVCMSNNLAKNLQSFQPVR